MIEKDKTVYKKEESIQELVKKVSALDRENFLSTVDYWDSDLCAIGFTNLKSQERVIYICSHGQNDGSFHYECDVIGDDPDNDVTIEKGDGASTEQVLEKIQTFLIDLRE